MIAAKAISIPADREILHVIQQNFVVDAQSRIREPIGMSGARLEAYAYIITGGTTAIQNLLNSIEKAGVPIVETLVAAPLAATQAAISKDEREVGIALVDIGDGTTEVIVYKEDSIEPYSRNSCWRTARYQRHCTILKSHPSRSGGT